MERCSAVDRMVGGRENQKFDKARVFHIDFRSPVSSLLVSASVQFSCLSLQVHAILLAHLILALNVCFFRVVLSTLYGCMFIFYCILALSHSLPVHTEICVCVCIVLVLN